MPIPSHRIFIVDDDASVRKALRRLLRAFGFSAATFGSGQEVMNVLPAEKPDCIILDVVMPGLSGLEVQQQLNSAGYEVPLIFISAAEAPSVSEQALRSGAVAFLGKPFSDEILLQALLKATGETTAPGSRDAAYD